MLAHLKIKEIFIYAIWKRNNGKTIIKNWTIETCLCNCRRCRARLGCRVSRVLHLYAFSFVMLTKIKFALIYAILMKTNIGIWNDINEHSHLRRRKFLSLEIEIFPGFSWRWSEEKFIRFQQSYLDLFIWGVNL